MKNIRDLHFNKEIVPLFDFVGNEYSRDTLIRLLSEIPDTMEEVLYRQTILKTMLKNQALTLPFSYTRSEFTGAYSYTEGINSREINPQPAFLNLTYFFSRSKRDLQRGGLSQLFLFLDKIERAWFSQLNPAAFPEPFASELNRVMRLLAELQVGKWAGIARKKGFSISELARLTGMVDEKARNGEMEAAWKAIFLFEAYLSVSKGIQKHNFIFPTFSASQVRPSQVDPASSHVSPSSSSTSAAPVFAITGFYHPLIKNPITNHLTVQHTVTLITGPNMSGKSTLLKAIGLSVLLAHLGIAVPAETCELPFFDIISIAIDLNDDIISGYSHFMVEVKNVKNVVTAARNSKRCFAIFDELFRGTNPEDALEISGTTIRGLTRYTDSFFFISTHLHQLKGALEPCSDRISSRHLECQLIDGVPSFTYQLRDGWSDLKIGQLLFNREGLNVLLSD